MGRAKAKRAAGIKLTREEFFELQVRITTVALAAADARKKATERIVKEIERELQPVMAKRAKCFTALAEKYHFDAEATFRLDEATCSLVPVNESAK